MFSSTHIQPQKGVGVSRPQCGSCAHWLRGYDVTPIQAKRGWPVSRSCSTGWCQLDVPAEAHPTITGWSQDRGKAGIETKESSVCAMFIDELMGD